jgi:hypothetical protein
LLTQLKKGKLNTTKIYLIREGALKLMEINPSNSIANAAKANTATVAKTSPIDDATKLNQASTTDTVTLSAEATAAAAAADETPTPQHGGGGVHIPDKKNS